MPEVFAKCYQRHTNAFMLLRKFRDNILHNGSQVPTIYTGNSDFMINRNTFPFADVEIWNPGEINDFNLVPLTPVLALMVNNTLVACEDFSRVLSTTVVLPPALAPNMHLYMRGYFSGLLRELLVDINNRIANSSAFVKMKSLHRK